MPPQPPLEAREIVVSNILPDHTAQLFPAGEPPAIVTLPLQDTPEERTAFLEYDLLTQSIYGGKRFEVYYCHSYSAWEKGTNENHNRLLRRFFPKGTDFTKVSQRQIQEAVDWMNNYPRKVLGWLTPAEAGRL